MMRNWFAVIGFVVVAMVVGVCVACSDDEDDESGWGVVGLATVVADAPMSSEPPPGEGPGRRGEDKDGCSDQCGQHSDCENNSGECSDDDQLQVGPICVNEGACRFG